MTHTKGPLVFDHSRIGWWIEAPTDKSRQLAYGAIPADVWQRNKDERDNCEALTNARRFTASWNALEGFDIAAIEAGVVKELVEAVREWKSAKEAFADFERENPNNSTKVWDNLFYAKHAADDALVAALAKIGDAL